MPTVKDAAQISGFVIKYHDNIYHVRPIAMVSPIVVFDLCLVVVSGTIAIVFSDLCLVVVSGAE